MSDLPAKNGIRFGEPGYWSHRAQTGFRGPNKALSVAQLWELACQYFEEVDATPFKKQDFIKGGDAAGQIVELDNIRPYTWQGFENYLASNNYIHSLDAYRQNKEGRYSEYVDVIKAIANIIYDQKFSGAAVGAFNANIIIPDLGLIKKTQVSVIEEQPLFGDAPEAAHGDKPRTLFIESDEDLM